MNVVKFIVCVAVLAFFCWLIVPSPKSKRMTPDEERAASARRRGFTMGFIMQRRKDNDSKR